MSNPIYFFIPIFCMACDPYDGPVYFSSGTYKMDPDVYTEIVEDDSSEMAMARLAIDLEAGTMSVTGTTQDVSLTLVERDQNDYETHCEMQLSATLVQTFDIQEEFPFLDETMADAFLASDSCDEDEVSSVIKLVRSGDWKSFHLIKEE